jgi:hypothetical protein
MKPALFFDFDDTLVETREASRRYIRHRYGVTMPEELYLCGNSLWIQVNELLPPGKKVEKDSFYVDWRDNFLTSDEWHEDARPIGEAPEVIAELSVHFVIWIVTARQLASRLVVEKLCQRFFGQHISGTHFVWDGDGKFQAWVERSKKDFISGFDGSKMAFIDDNPGEIQKVQEVLTSYLFDPAGFHHQVPGINFRVSSWREIAGILL